MTQLQEAVWHFHCPECGFGDREFGYLLPDDEIHCLICLEEDRREVGLRRWLVEEVGEARLRRNYAEALTSPASSSRRDCRDP